MVGVPAFPVGTEPSTSEVADWVELSALARHNAFKKGDLKSAISKENVAHPDMLEEESWKELGNRSALFGAMWPLILTGSRLTRRSPSPVSLPLYRFLCLLGLGLADKEDRTLFELLVARLMSPITGRLGLHVGAPASDGMDPSFRERIKVYATEARLLDGEVKAKPLPNDQDLGLDVVSWSSFADGRGAELHFLAQCSTGSDWVDKLHDIDLNVWSDHVNWAVRPVRVFALPIVVTLPEAKWIRTARKGGLVLDRPRLVELACRSLHVDALTLLLRRRVTQLSAA